MNDVTETGQVRQTAKPVIVRPRDAASLILLRGAGRDLELLAGRRPGHVKFMPGVWVFPGGAIDREDNKPWRVESGGGRPPPPAPRPAPPPACAGPPGGGGAGGRPPPPAAPPPPAPLPPRPHPPGR